ncbi:aldehyde dehydrogenase family protein [Candidatus Haliotispira prima]|uniref:Aldehyde dehydrogenase family protein n=1 Tax=Candidatus Haliotispira prima TaxID=3034016 RepID=A0ABY8MGF2_9SPIO|nr:aldehyde dehydrogenase family protein [Candidatus Haliotispira prima]
MDAKMLIHGKECPAVSGEVIPVFNPATEEQIGTVPNGAEADADKAIDSAYRASGPWSRLPAPSRADLLFSFADKLSEQRERFARLLCTEHGKIFREGLEEIDGAAMYLRQAARSILSIRGDILFSSNPREQVWIQKVPYGVTVGLIAWNFPIALAARKLGPALAAGNSMVIHAPTEVPLAVCEFAKLALEAGLPEGVFNVVTGRPEQICPALIQNPLTRLVSHTGSTAAGQKIIQSSANNVTELILELGGKAPYIVLDDADIDAAAEAAVVTRFYNGGQVCTCNERTFLHEAIYDSFMEKFIAKTKKLTVGGPFSDADIGPKVLQRDVQRIEALVQNATDAGASIEYRYEPAPDADFSKGYWSFPTILSQVQPDMAIMKEEIFGPVVPIMKVSGFREAISLANRSEYGLAAYLWTKDVSRIMETVQDLECGEIYVNRGIGEQPHGYHTGLKKSGLAGEDGLYGLDHYLHKKTYYLRF